MTPPKVAWLTATVMVILYVTAVLTPFGQALDTGAMYLTAELLGGTPWTDTWLWLISPGSVGLVTCVLVGVNLKNRDVVTALWSAASIGATVLAADALKLLLARPSWLDDAANSLPSGHVAAIAALCVEAVGVGSARARAAIVASGAVVLALTTAATLAEEWHRPSDAVAAVLLAICVSATAATLRATPWLTWNRHRHSSNLGTLPVFAFARREWFVIPDRPPLQHSDTARCREVIRRWRLSTLPPTLPID